MSHVIVVNDIQYDAAHVLLAKFVSNERALVYFVVLFSSWYDSDCGYTSNNLYEGEQTLLYKETTISFIETSFLCGIVV